MCFDIDIPLVKNLTMSQYAVACYFNVLCAQLVESSWNVMAHGVAREGKWRGNWRMEWVASNLHTTLEHVSSITTADAHTSAASSWLNWRPCRFKWTRPFRRKTKSGFWACAITFQTQSTSVCYWVFLFLIPLHLTGYVTNRINIQQLYALSTLHLCVSYLSENKQRLVPLTA